MKKPCNCSRPRPRPHKGPSEYIPSMTYPLGGLSGAGPCCEPGLPPPPPPHPIPPEPDPEPKPCPCPPRVYRNPPDVELVEGRNIELDVEKTDTKWIYTVSSKADRTDVFPGDHVEVHREVTDEGTNYTIDAVQFPVVIDKDSEDALYGDGTPENPLGINDFEGATASEDGQAGAVPMPYAGEQGMFLRGDGTWANVDNTRECTAAEMDAWIDEVENG